MNYFTGKKWNICRRKSRKEEKTDYREYHLSVKEWVFCIGQITGIVAAVNYFCYRSGWVFVSVLPVGVWYVQWKKKQKAERRKCLLYYHFQDVLQGLQTAVRAGYSMEQAVRECRKGLEQVYGPEEDLVRELRYIEQQMKVGVPVERLFLDLGQRSDVEDIRSFGEIFLISKRSGGNLGEIIEKMAGVLGEKIRVEREIEVCIAGKKMEQMVMSLVPGGMILYMQVTSAGFLDVLYGNAAGAAVMTLCLGIYLFSFRMGRKIVRISV